MRNALVFALLLLAGCRAPTETQQAAAVRSAVDVGRAACLVAQAKRIELTESQRAWCYR